MHLSRANQAIVVALRKSCFGQERQHEYFTMHVKAAFFVHFRLDVVCAIGESGGQVCIQTDDIKRFFLSDESPHLRLGVKSAKSPHIQVVTSVLSFSSWGKNIFHATLSHTKTITYDWRKWLKVFVLV